ncbi:MAG TPA: ABC transporter ATP-binding protein [Herpetosiphonaceae bacterium]
MNIPIRRYGSLLSAYLRPQWRRVAALALLLGGGIGLQLLNPQILRSFIDDASAGAATDRLVTLAGFFIGIAFLNQLATVGATYVSENIGWTATNALRNALAAHCLGLDMSFHKQRTSGELIERIDGDIDALSAFFSQLAVGVLSNLALMTGALGLLFLEDWRVGLALLLFALTALAVLVRLRSLAVPSLAATREASAQFFGFLGERLAGTEDIRANGGTGAVMRQFHRHTSAWLPLQRRASLAMYAMWMTTIGLFAIGNAVAFGISAALWRSGSISIGTVYMIFYYTELLRRPIEQIRTQIQDLQRAGASIGRVEELRATQPTILDGPGDALAGGPLAVECDGVGFGYDDERVLESISLRLAPGRVLGLLGRTGSGKTTLARLILRLYDVSAGAIRLGGTDVREVTVAALRQRVGIVTQDVQLFHATVRDNLTFFNPAIPDERLREALDQLGLGPWLAGLPRGLDTELAGSGSLSAGEAQLLAFARLFLADPGLIILDEASSRLDPATEQLIERAVSRLLAGRTGIIIAHRLATVQRADDILILERGEILEHGPRADLAADQDSRFAGLLRTGLSEVLA